MATPLAEGNRSDRRRAARIEADVLRRCFRKPPKLSVTEWAERHRFLSPEASSAAVEAGAPVRYSSVLAPYQRRAMEALSDPRVRTVVLMWPSQVGKTEILNNFIGRQIHLSPGPMLVIQPTLQMAEAWSKDRLAPMLRDTPVLRGLVKDARSRDADNTILHKKFPGGHLTVGGANSPAGLASRPIRDILADEVDRYTTSAGTEGDPIGLAFRRGATFRTGKRLLISSPTIKDKSRIEHEYKLGTQESWKVPCPHCGHVQALRWGTRDSAWGIKWEDGTPETAHYVCEQCACVIEEKWKDWMNARGDFYGLALEDAPDPTRASLWMNALASPWTSWVDYVREFLQVKSDPDKLQQFVNTVLCETFEIIEDDELDTNSLATRAESWADAAGRRIEVPHGVGLLTMAVDVQGDRLEAEIRGWGAGEESWLIAHHRLYGDPTQQEVWGRLEAIRTRIYHHASGAPMRISVTCVDSGHEKNAVYRYVAAVQAQGVYAVKGEDGAKREPVAMSKSKNRAGVKLVIVGTYAMKDTLLGRLKFTRPGPGYIHFRARDPDWHNGADAEYYAQFGREQKKKRKIGERWQVVYAKSGPNEAIDLGVYNLAALYLLGPNARENLGAWAAQASAWKAPVRAAGATAVAGARGRRVRSRGMTAA